MQQLIVAHRQLLQFRPAIDLTAYKPGRLDDLKAAGIVEVAKLHIPCPAASRYSERLASVDKWGNTVSQSAALTGIDEREVTFLERVLGGDVTHENVQ